ncbi:MAG: hypothetical protein ACTSXJ_04185 [Candidatus Baldrarchaeia archaeon]
MHPQKLLDKIFRRKPDSFQKVIDKKAKKISNLKNLVISTIDGFILFKSSVDEDVAISLVHNAINKLRDLMNVKEFKGSVIMHIDKGDNVLLIGYEDYGIIFVTSCPKEEMETSREIIMDLMTSVRRVFA